MKNNIEALAYAKEYLFNRTRAEGKLEYYKLERRLHYNIAMAAERLVAEFGEITKRDVVMLIEARIMSTDLPVFIVDTCNPDTAEMKNGWVLFDEKPELISDYNKRFNRQKPLKTGQEILIYARKYLCGKANINEDLESSYEFSNVYLESALLNRFVYRHNTSRTDVEILVDNWMIDNRVNAKDVLVKTK